MKQQTLAMAQDQGFEQYRKRTRRGQFLGAMSRIMPWEALYDSAGLRRFASIDPGREYSPASYTSKLSPDSAGESVMSNE